MKKYLLAGFLLAPVWLAAQVGELPGEYLDAEQKIFLALQEPPAVQAVDNFDIHYHRLQWQVDPGVEYLQGRVFTGFTMRADAGFIEFELNPALSVDTVWYHGQSLGFQHSAEGIIHITLPAAIPSEQSDSIEIIYHGVPTATGFGSIEFSQHNGTPVMWTLSEPFGARDWWPCKQTLNDKIDSVDIWVTCPEVYKVASNGLLAGEYPTSIGWKTHHWKHRYAIPAYLIAFAVTDYTVFTQSVPFEGDTVQIINYVYPEKLADAIAGTEAIVPIMQLFDTLFGIYPFHEEKYGHAQFGWGGGMEHQTISFMGGFGFELMAHELAHHWFGDMVTCGSWRDIWLNEGFATYLSGLCYEHIRPQWWRNFREGRINSIVSQPGGSVYCPDTTDVGRIFSGRLSYSKGAMVLHMLRWKLGDADFYQGIRNYLHDPAIRFGYALTPQLQAHLEAASGMDLEEFFQDWIYGQGYPSYTLHQWPCGGDTTCLQVWQTSSDVSVDFFEMPLPVKLASTDQDTLLVLQHQFSGEIFRIRLPFQPQGLAFDPDLWLVATHQIILSAMTPSANALPLKCTPNPVENRLVLQFSAEKSAEGLLQVFDAGSRLIHSEIRRIQPGENDWILDVGTLPAGIFTVTLYEEGVLWNGRFLKR